MAYTCIIGSLYLYVWRILAFRIWRPHGSFTATMQCQFKSPVRLGCLQKQSLTVGVFKLRHSCDHRIMHFHSLEWSQINFDPLSIVFLPQPHLSVSRASRIPCGSVFGLSCVSFMPLVWPGGMRVAVEWKFEDCDLVSIGTVDVFWVALWLELWLFLCL